MIFYFKCPVCRKQTKTGSRFEPCCTGPSESLDEHELTVMRLTATSVGEIDPVKAEQSAQGPLILPAGYNS